MAHLREVNKKRLEKSSSKRRRVTGGGHEDLIGSMGYNTVLYMYRNVKVTAWHHDLCSSCKRVVASIFVANTIGRRFTDCAAAASRNAIL